MSLLTIANVRAQINTGLSDTDLQTVIDTEESEMVRRCGANGDGTTAVTEVVVGGKDDLCLSRPFVSITSVTERASDFDTDTVIAATSYLTWPRQGRLTRNGTWGSRVSVVFVPIDDRPRRKLVLMELIRLSLEQTAMQAESVAGEYSYTAPDWDAKRAALYRRLMFASM